MSKINKVAVYGSLRKGMGNHNFHLGKAEYKGTFDTPPIYGLYALGGYPGLKLNGGTSVRMEIFEVDDKQLKGVNELEGYDETHNTENTFYNRIVIDTPYGKAYTYIYIPEVSQDSLVSSGDWKEHYSLSETLV